MTHALELGRRLPAGDAVTLLDQVAAIDGLSLPRLHRTDQWPRQGESGTSCGDGASDSQNAHPFSLPGAGPITQRGTW